MMDRPTPVLGGGPRLYNLREAAAMLGGVGRNHLNDEINNGRLRAVRLGKGWKIPAEWLQEYVERLKTDQAARPTRPQAPRERVILPASIK